MIYQRVSPQSSEYEKFSKKRPRVQPLHKSKLAIQNEAYVFDDENWLKDDDDETEPCEVSYIPRHFTCLLGFDGDVFTVENKAKSYKA